MWFVEPRMQGWEARAQCELVHEACMIAKHFGIGCKEHPRSQTRHQTKNEETAGALSVIALV